MRWLSLMIVLCCVMLSLGGTFTCKGENNSGDFTENPRTPVGNR